MKMLGFEQFMDDFGRAAKNTMNLSVYRDNFKCACGQNHWFGSLFAFWGNPLHIASQCF